MCDRIRKKNVNPPQYTYKVVLKIKNGVYASPVMGAPMLAGRWLVAPKIPKPNLKQKYASLVETSLIKKAFSKYKTFALYKRKAFIQSSSYSENHYGKWASFKSLKGAKSVNLARNFTHKKPVIVKCEIGGECHAAEYCDKQSFLSERIKIIEEV